MIKKEKKQQGELLYGLNPTIELLKAGKRKLISLYTTRPTPKNWKALEALLPAHIPVQYVSRDILTRMVATPDHQGVVAWVQAYPYRKKPFDPVAEPFIVLLDGIQDPRNMGAIIRSAYCAGADGVIIVAQQSPGVTATVCKAAAGYVEHVPICMEPSISSALATLKKSGYTLYSAAFGGKPVGSIDFSTVACCIIIGAEGTGISNATEKSSIHVTIPQRFSTISYNASVAAGIILYTVGSAKKKII